MPRKRMVDTAFWTSESLAECSHSARLCYIGLWCYAKDDGRARFSPRSMRSFIFPMDDMTMEEFLSLLAELEQEGCISFYVVGDEVYLSIPKFSKYQTISHPQESGMPKNGIPVTLHERSMNVPPKELKKELIKEAESGGSADAPPASFFDASAYLKSMERKDA